MLSLSKRHIFSPIVLFSSFAGQPTASSHPQLLSPGELLPGFHESVFRARRERLFQAIPDNSLVFVSGYKLRYTSKNILYAFHSLIH